MKILYVGGVWPCEYSLFKESQSNPNLDVKFCGFSKCMCNPNLINRVKIANRDGIDRVKDEFKPDLTIFRSWCNEENLIHDDEVLWCQEIYADKPLNYGNVKAKIKAYQSSRGAEVYKGLWLPYCVSRYWSSDNHIRDIPIILATSLCGSKKNVMTKTLTLNILAKPLVEQMPHNIHVYNGYHGRLNQIKYLDSCFKPSFHPINVDQYLSKSKIYLSPNSTLDDEGGMMSYKPLEAMAFGCLVFLVYHEGLENILGRDGQNLIYSNSPKETLDKVTYYLAHEKEREEVAFRGREFVLKNYSWETHLNRLLVELKG